MGSSSSTPAAAAPPAAAPTGGCPVKHDAAPAPEAPAAAAQGGCPVKHSASPAPEAPEAPAGGGGCPVKHGKGGSGAGAQQFNVYAQPIDPKNRMPLNPNQLPSPGQSKPLSTERVQSHIPKGGADGETWSYPSPQMFYNALMRKGKLEDGEAVDEDEVETIVAVHNNMNEKTWNRVLRWEKALHGDDYEAADGVRLSRFMGRPDDISPMAWLKKTFLGYPHPFDRHDWVVVRNGKEVRYVIDYYYDEDRSKEDEKPTLHDVQSIKSITMDVRPAVDDVTSLVDRVRFPVLEKLDMVPDVPMGATERANAEAKEMDAATQAGSVAAETTRATATAAKTTFNSMDAKQLGELSRRIGPECQACFRKVDSCASEAECQKASVALTYCMASLVCPPEAERYKGDLSSESKLDDMVACMGRFETAALQLRQEQLVKQQLEASNKTE